MGRGPGGHHAGEIPCGDGVGGGTAQSLALVFAFDAAFGQRQPAGTHGAVLAAGPLHADVAGLHGHRAVEDRIDAQLLRPLDHLLGGDINRSADRIGDLFGLGGLFLFFFSHLVFPPLESPDMANMIEFDYFVRL